jgi:hypothetical protein
MSHGKKSKKGPYTSKGVIGVDKWASKAVRRDDTYMDKRMRQIAAAKKGKKTKLPEDYMKASGQFRFPPTPPGVD